MKRPALVIMARQPVPGHVKTRLQPALTLEQSAGLYTAFLRDTIDLVLATKFYTPFLAFIPRNARAFFNSFVPEGINLMPQTGKDLGERISNIATLLMEKQYNPVVIIGSDIPTLQTETLEQALESLKSSDLCFGPSPDGGYYLIGMKGTVPDIFEEISWSTSQVLEMTLKKATAMVLSVAILGIYTDVDTFADLKWLRKNIVILRQTEGSRVPFHTEIWLNENKLPD